MPRSNDTRQRLLEASIAVIEAKGESALRIDQIAAAVGVTKPSIYHFFGDREGLVVAALAEMYRRGLDPSAEAFVELANLAPTPEGFRIGVERIFASFNTAEGVERRALRTEVLGAAVKRPRLQQAILEVHHLQAERIARFVEIGRARGVVGLPFDARAAAMFAIAVVAGRHYAEIDDSIDLETWDDLTVEVIRHLLFGDPSSR